MTERTPGDGCTYYGDAVRTRTDHTKHDQPYEVVETARFVDRWVEVRRFGHMSDDLAISNARKYAQSLSRVRVGGH